MQEVYEFIWVLGCLDREGKFRKMSKCGGLSPLDLDFFQTLDDSQKHSLLSSWPGETFFLSAQDAFSALNKMDPETAKSFAVFEIKIEKVFKLSSPSDEGCSLR